jgi:hypothetical protein
LILTGLVVWHKKITREVGRPKLSCCSVLAKVKEFDKNFVESLLEGVKANVKSIGDNGVNFFLFLIFLISEENILFAK